MRKKDEKMCGEKGVKMVARGTSCKKKFEILAPGGPRGPALLRKKSFSEQIQTNECNLSEQIQTNECKDRPSATGL